jgi:hypothetical protein
MTNGQGEIMASSMRTGRRLSDARAWTLAGILAIAGLAGGQAIQAQTASSRSQETSPQGPDNSHAAPAVSFFASERSDFSAAALESRLSPRPTGGSLILNELRTQRGAARTERPLVPDLDPRTKPLGW